MTWAYLYMRHFASHGGEMAVTSGENRHSSSPHGFVPLRLHPCSTQNTPEKTVLQL